jgi:hypothetical protein
LSQVEELEMQLGCAAYSNKIKTDELKNFSGSVEEDNVSGKLNGGGTQVIARAGSGRVNISFK